MVHTPCTYSMVHTPCTDLMVHTPCTYSMVHTPCTDLMVHTPRTYPMVHTPCTYSMVHTPCTDLMVHTPRTYPMVHTPCTYSMVYTPCTDLMVHIPHGPHPMYRPLGTHTLCTNRTPTAWWYCKPIFFPQPCKPNFVSVNQISCCVAEVRFGMSETRVTVITLKLQLILHSSVSVGIRWENRKSIYGQNFSCPERPDRLRGPNKHPGGLVRGLRCRVAAADQEPGLRMRGTTPPPPLIFTGWRLLTHTVVLLLKN